MIARIWIASVAAILLSTAAHAGCGTPVPGPLMGDGVPGIVIAVVLVGAFFVFRQIRRKRVD